MSDPKANAVLVDALGSALQRGGHALGTVPELLKRVLAEESWRKFVTKRGEEVSHERFAEFVVTPPLRGLGATVDLVKRVVAGDPEAEKALRDVLKDQGHRSDIRNNVTEVEVVTGNARAYALDRLAREAPELHAQVLAGKMSAHAAMVKAGFRPRTFTVRPEPKSAARTLRKYMTADQLAELVRLLTQEGDI